MYAQYTAIEGFTINANSVLALIMTATAADVDVDQSGNTNDFTENGTLTKSAVKTGAETLFVSGFSAANYLSRAYDADFDPGTSGFSIAFDFVAADNANTEVIFERDSATTAQNYGAKKNPDGTITVTVDDGTTTRSASSSLSYEDSEVHEGVMVFDGSTLDLYIDKILVGTATGTALNTLSNASAVFYVGRGVSTANPWSGSIAGIEVDIGNQWTAQYIATRYETVSILFSQYEPFSIVGETIGYQAVLTNSKPGVESRASINESPFTGKRSGVLWYQKDTYNCQTFPVQGRAERAKMKKFIRNTIINSFVWDELGTSLAADDPITVYRIGDGSINRIAPDFYELSFNIREV